MFFLSLQLYVQDNKIIMVEGYLKIYEVSIAFVTAILGLAYPMFVERINGIMDKYRTRRVSEKFKSEISYKCFNVWLLVCLVELFVCPIVMVAFSSNYWNQLLITIQGITAFVLCMLIVIMYHLVLTYSDPYKYFEKAKANGSEKEFLDDLQMLIVYASKDERNDGLFNDAMTELMVQVMKFQRRQVENNIGSQDITQFVYPDYIMQVLTQLMRTSSEKDKNMLNKRADIVDVLYNNLENFPITKQIYSFMWIWINNMVGAEHDDWLKQYWSIATQYYNSRLDNPNMDQEKEKFLEFHLMMGALLLYRKRYDVLRYAFTFTTSFPPKYPLMPNAFIRIFEYCEKFPPTNQPFYLSNYYMSGDYEGAMTESKIEGYLLDYLALLLVRLKSVDNFNITYSNPFDLPVESQIIEENDYKINRIRALKNHLEKISENVLSAVELNQDWKSDAIKLLKEYEERCVSTNQKLSNRKVVSEEKRKIIRDNLVKAINVVKPHLPSCDKAPEGKRVESFPAEQVAKLPEELILDSHSPMGTYLAESMVQGLYIQLRQFYCHQFLLNSPVRSYTISYRDLGEALKRLSLTSSYALLAINVTPHLFDEVEGFVYKDGYMLYADSRVYSISFYGDALFLVMREEDVPRFIYRDLDENEYDESKEKIIALDKTLYSNIDSLTAENCTLIVKQGFGICMPQQLRYFHLRIDYRLQSDHSRLSKIVPVKSLL